MTPPERRLSTPVEAGNAYAATLIGAALDRKPMAHY